MNAPEFLKAIGLDRDHKRWVELRYLADNKRPIARFYPSVDKIDFREVHRRNQEGYGVYFGVGLRRTQSGKQEDVASISCLWADLDGKDFDRDDPELGKKLALEYLWVSLPSHLQPTIIIDSGHGYHCYWTLEESWGLNDPTGVNRIVAVLKGLAAQLRGDLKCAEVARVMRLPETLNQKFQPPVLCQVIEATTERTFNLLDFEDYEDISDLDQPQRTQPRQNGSSGQRKESLLSRKTLEFLAGGADDGDRNNRLFIAACDMKGCDWELEEAESKLLESALQSGLVERAARRTIQSAFSKERSAVHPDSPPSLIFDDIVAELDTLTGSATSVIQERAWLWVEEITDWPMKEIFQLSDRLRNAGLTNVWLGDWKSAIKDAQRQKKLERARGYRQSEPGDAAAAESSLPLISITGRRLREISGDAIRALQSSNDPPYLFVRGGQPSRVTVDEMGYASIQILDRDALCGRLERVADFVRIEAEEGGKSDIPVPPPDNVVKDVLALGTWHGMPSLQGIVTAPVVAPNGELSLEPGYLPDAQLYYHNTGDLCLGDTTPTTASVALAKELIFTELLGQFPFADEASRAHTLVLMLSPFVRSLIVGPMPHVHIGAPIEGTGKGLLADVAISPFDPAGARVMTVALSAEEMRKRITAVLLGGPSHVLLDNVQGRLDSAELAAAITASIWFDRLLGQTVMLNLPVRCVWLSTGNNVALSPELARRTVYIRLDAQVEMPWKRQGYRHPHLREWAHANRSSLVTACLTLVRCWLEQGMPLAKPRLGSFESWSQVMGGILDAIGVAGFLGNIDTAHQQMATERQIFGAFVQAWHDRFKEQAVGVTELFPIASTLEIAGEGDPTTLGQDMLASELGDGNERSRRIRLGRLLGEKTDRVYGSLRLVSAGTVTNAAQFRLEAVNGHGG